MKQVTLSCIAILIVTTMLLAQDTKQIKGMPEGTSGSYSTQTARIEKVFAATQNGARFRAYQVKWMNQDVIVSDTLVTTDLKKGDTISFMAQSMELPLGNEKIKVLQFMVMDFSKFNQTK